MLYILIFFNKLIKRRYIREIVSDHCQVHCLLMECLKKFLLEKRKKRVKRVKKGKKGGVKRVKKEFHHLPLLKGYGTTPSTNSVYGSFFSLCSKFYFF